VTFDIEDLGGLVKLTVMLLETGDTLPTPGG
jgi:hypothetical protein